MLLQQTILRTGKPSQPDRSLDPSKLEFGRWCTPNFFQATYDSEGWTNLVVEPLHNFSLHPASMVFHYAQSIFEGLKAYKWPDGSVRLFRPDQNAKRLNSSARRMSMPELPERIFLDAITNLVDLDRAFVPSSPGSLYIRPTMIASEACLGIRTSKEFLFYIITLPAGGYFPNAPIGAGCISVQVAESVARAARGGTGAIKASANYAVTLKAIEEAKKKRYDQVLFLDARGDRLIEEMGGMNIFFVRDGELLTPATDTILPGITRDSVIQLAHHLSIPVRETPLNIDEVMSDIRSGRITEALACGTAAVITGIGSLTLENGETVGFGSNAPGRLTNQLYELLQGIQFGLQPDLFGWTVEVEKV